MRRRVRKVGPKGQVVIEKEIRDELGIEPGWEAIQHIENGQVVMTFIPPKHHRSLFGILAPHIKRSFPTEEALNQAKEEAWALAATEEMGSSIDDEESQSKQPASRAQ